MASAAAALTFLALAGAVASWVAGAVFFARSLAATGRSSRGRWLAIAAWPFARRSLAGAPAEQNAVVNKALVAFIACVMVAAASWSASTNLHRLTK